MVAALWSGFDMIQNNRFVEAIENLSSSRSDVLKQLFDPRRDIYDECGYPKGYLQPELYQDLFERNSIAARVIEVMSKECFHKQPTVFETKDTSDETEFEKQWKDMCNGLLGEQSWFRDPEVNPIWQYVLRADILAGIGQYGVMFLCIDDGKELREPADTLIEKNSIPRNVPKKDASGKPIPDDDPAPPALNINDVQPPYSLTINAKAPKRKLLQIRCFPETQARISQYEGNRSSPRFGYPTMYSITMQDPDSVPAGGGAISTGLGSATLRTVYVHWTRCIHIVDNYNQASSSQIAASPRLRPVLNHILALEKIYGGSGEGYWTSSIPKTILETHPSLGGDVLIDKRDIRNQLENMRNSLQKELVLMGMSAKTLAPLMIDPTPFVKTHMGAIAIKLGIPLRILEGSERGELASGQDDGQHNDNIRGRNNNHTIPVLVAELVNRCIMLKCITPPKESFGVYWPDIETQSARAKADIAYVRTQALGQYTSLGIEQHMCPLDYLMLELDYDRETAELIIENAKKAMEEKMDDAQELADKHGMIPTLPGMTTPEDKAPVKVKDGEKLVHPDTVKKPVGLKSQQDKPSNGSTND